MAALVLIIIFGIVALVAGGIFLISAPKKVAQKDRFGKEIGVSVEGGEARFPSGIAAGVAILLIVVIAIIGSIVIVPNGNVSVMVRFQNPTGQVLEQGFHFKPIIDNPVHMSIQTQKYEVDCSAATKDLQDVTSVIAVNYKLDRNKAVEVYKTLGLKYFEVIAHPAVQEVVKSITSQYNAEDMILKRQEVKNAIATTLKERMGERGIISEIINMKDFSFSEVFDASIEAKVAASQAVLTAENKKQQAMVDAQTAKEVAVGIANAAVEKANGEARAISIITDARVKSNNDINVSLTDKVLQYVFIDRMSDKVQVWVVPEGQGFNISPK